jgi:hypothetical protein
VRLVLENFSGHFLARFFGGFVAAFRAFPKMLCSATGVGSSPLRCESGYATRILVSGMMATILVLSWLLLCPLASALN